MNQNSKCNTCDLGYYEDDKYWCTQYNKFVDVDRNVCLFYGIESNAENMVVRKATEFDMVLDEINDMFYSKNKEYRSDSDIFNNFRQTAIRHFGSASKENMIKTLLIYADKHASALAVNGFNDSNFEERCIDLAVYHIIAVCISRMK